MAPCGIVSGLGRGSGGPHVHRSDAPRFPIHAIVAALGILLGAAASPRPGGAGPTSGLSAQRPPAPDPSSAPKPRGPRYVDGEVLIVFQPGARASDVRAILADLGATRVHIARRSRVERHRIQGRVEDAVAKYRGHPAVRIIEPNYLIHAEAVPNDPSFPVQWSLSNTGQQGGTPGSDIHAIPAWDHTTGSNQVVVAIIDTGMDLAHPDLAPNLYTNGGEIPDNGLDDDGNGFADDVHGFDFANFDSDPSDDNGHGTHVAGTIGARGDNGIGITGVVWRVRLLPLKFLDASGTGTTSDAIDCVDYAVMAGATVINASWGSSENSAALELAIAGANSAGVLFVAAAGNTGSSNDAFPQFPASYPDANVISVGATGRSDERAGFSNFGHSTVDLFAPGVQILSTLRGGQYGLMSGTSMAAPHVSGAIALLKSRFPAMGAPTMKSIVMSATDRVPGLANLAVVGGRLNAARMLEGVDSTDPGPVGDLASSFVSSDRVTVAWTATGDDGTTGTATEYELRYALTPITDATFSEATRVLSGVPPPRAPGAREEAVVRGLMPDTEYSIALVARDEFGNPSPLSNVITVHTTAPPVAALDPGAIGDTLLTGQHATAVLTLRNDGAGALDFTAQAAGTAGAPAPQWLSVLPNLGSAGSGNAATLTVSLNASGLATSDRTAIVRLTTNDPARPRIDVPVAVHVISAPNIDVFPLPFAFGPIVVGNTDSQELSITNTGFADLHVTSVHVEGSDFATDETPIFLGPGDGWLLFVTATPSQTGPITGTLVLQSDDPDQPELRVPLSATGIIPPVAGVVPGRQDATLHTGQTTTRSFTISNSGGTVLSWSLRARSAAGLEFDSTGALTAPLQAVSSKGGSAVASGSSENAEPSPAAVEAQDAAAPSADLSDVRIVFDSRHGASSGAWGDLIGTMTSRGALFTLNTRHLSAGVLAGADVYWVSEDAGAFETDERSALATWVRNGGSLLLEGAAAAEWPEFNALLDSTGVPLRFDGSTAGITGPTNRIYPFEITRGVLAADMPTDLPRLVATGLGPTLLVEDAHALATLAATFVGRGRVLAAAGRIFADVSAILGNNRILASRSFDWLGGAAWLAPSPTAGSTAPGQASSFAVSFDAEQMAGGEYRGALVVRTNDPDHAQFLVPVNLIVTPAPDVVVSRRSIDLGSVFVGASTVDSLAVRNEGLLPLAVSSVSLAPSDFTAPFDAVSLAPGASTTIRVRYTPTAVGPASAILLVHTDDPDEPEISVVLAASGAPAPDVDIVAGPVTAALATGGTASRTITVANRAGSDLEFSVHFEEEAPARATAADSGPRSSDPAAGPRTWAEAFEAARARPRILESNRALTAAGTDSLPLVVLDPNGDGSVVDLASLRAWARDGVLSVRLEMNNDLAPSNFGGYVSLDIDQNPLTGRPPSFGNPRQDIGTEFEVSLFSVAFGSVDLLDARTGNYVQSFPVEVGPRVVAFAIPLSRLQGDDGRMNVTGVIGNFAGATDWLPDRGHGTIGGLWLAAAPGAGTLAAGSEAPIELTLDARSLPAGSYKGSVVVETNDPDEPVLFVPASLEVTDAPVAAASTSAIHFGPVFVGKSAMAEVVVGNVGRAPLTIASVASDESDFIVDPDGFVLEPGATHSLVVTFRPASGGAIGAALTIAHDAAGGAITISMDGSGRVPPVVEVAPGRVESSLGLGAEGTAFLSIRNTGGSTLDYGIEPLQTPTAGIAPASVDPGAAPSAPLGRDDEDPRPGVAPNLALDIGGPDEFGYRWVDSNHPGGPIFDWQDIAAIGTPVPIRNLDQNSGPLPIGFAFPFYGQTFTTFNVCTHGWISFTDTTVSFLNQPLPTREAPGNLLAVFWDDLNFSGVEHATYYNDGTRLIVQYTNVLRRQRGGPFTFQVILYPTGAIVYQYLLMGPPTQSGTIGIQNRGGTDGLLVLFNADYLRDRMAIRFSAAPTWMGVEERYGRIEPGDSTNVSVALNAKDLFAGSYGGLLRVQTNDPAHPETLIPVLLHATGIPRLSWSPSALAFDTLEVASTALDTLRVTNQGTDRLEASIAFEPTGEFTAEPATLSLAPLQSAPVLVRFTPAAGGDRSGVLILSSNDPESPSVRIPISGTGRLSVRVLRAEIQPAVIRRQGQGRDVRARVFMPPDLDARAADLAGIRLQGVVPPIVGSARVRDLNQDGVLDLDVGFDRNAVERALPNGDAVAVSVTGEIRGATRFDARGVVRVLGTVRAAAGVEFEDETVPAVSAIRGAAPNPFVASASVRFDLAAGGPATLRVYTASGRLLRTVFQAPLPAGRFRAAWDGRDDRGARAPSGIYFARLLVSGAGFYEGVARLVRVR